MSGENPRCKHCGLEVRRRPGERPSQHAAKKFCSHACHNDHRRGKPLKSLEDRILGNSSETEGGCWIWQGFKNRTGYGVLRVRGRNRLAHQVALEVATGERAAGRYVLHSCDNPACVNPDHLRFGTQRENMEDCVKRGRIARGERAGAAKLTRSQVQEIRRRCKSGETRASVARDLGVSRQAISDIALRKKWKHV